MISEIIEKWIKGILIDGITGNLSGLFDNVNAKVGEIASDVGSTPQAWNSGIFNMLRSLSETVVLPIAAAILALVMCHELMFISLVRKYTRAKKLTPRMLNELVEKIEVFNAEKVNGVWEQRLRIHYNCVGTIEIPSALPLPTPDVSVNTRKGVVVNYAPCDVAI